MPVDKGESGVLRISLLLTLALSALFILFAFLPLNSWWGINHLAYFALHVKLIFIALIALALTPPVRRLFVSALDHIASAPQKIALPVGLAVALAGFITWRISVHSMGDSYVRMNQIEAGSIYLPSEFLDFLLHALVYRVLNLVGQMDAALTIAATSIIIGLVFIIIMIYWAPFEGRPKGLFIAGVLSLGCSQLFFGYVESYTLIYLFLTGYILIAFRGKNNQSSWTLLTVLYLLAGFSHQIGMVLLLPSYWYLSYKRFLDHRLKALAWAAAIIISILPYLVLKLLNIIVEYEELRSLADYILPLVDEVYGVLTPLHLFYIVNLFLLVAPIAIILFPLVVRGLLKRDQSRLAWSLIAPSVVFILLFNSELTLVRDWDLYSLPVAVMVLPVLVIFLQSFPSGKRSAADMASFLMISLILTASWIFLNNDVRAHLIRAEYIIDEAVVGQRYGYENLAHYYDRAGEYDEELRVLLKIKPGDRNARVYGEISQVYWVLGQMDEAYEYAMHGLEMPKPREINALMAGLTSYQKKHFCQAIRYFRGYLRLNPKDRRILWHLGDSFSKCDSLDKAIGVFNYLVSLDNRDHLGYYGLAGAYLRKGQYDQAEEHCRRGMALKPNAPGAQALWDSIQVLLPAQN